jgi:hypothetical protein
MAFATINANNSLKCSGLLTQIATLGSSIIQGNKQITKVVTKRLSRHRKPFYVVKTKTTALRLTHIQTMNPKKVLSELLPY